MRDIFGLGPQEYIATFEAFLERVHPDYRKYLAKSVEAVLNHGTRRENEFVILRSDESQRFVLQQTELSPNDNSTKLLALDGRLVTAAVRDITERKRAEEQINAALAEKEALLAEIHHRVKNNLQMVVSLLHLQSGHVKDEAAHSIFLDSENRVKAMALMHERLYRSEALSRIDLSDYIETLARDLFRAYGLESSGVDLQLDIEDLPLGIDTVIHCGLLVNELVSNAFKHAFPEGGKGKVTVALREQSAGRFELVVKDDGVGLPSNFDLTKSDTLGLQLISTLTDQLDGTLAVESSKGAEFRIVFRDRDEETIVPMPSNRV